MVYHLQAKRADGRRGPLKGPGCGVCVGEVGRQPRCRVLDIGDGITVVRAVIAVGNVQTRTGGFFLKMEARGQLVKESLAFLF